MSVQRFAMAEGFTMKLIASGPSSRQPIDQNLTARGRRWVVQYLQYPFPAGVTITGCVPYFRAEFDCVTRYPAGSSRRALPCMIAWSCAASSGDSISFRIAVSMGK